MSQRQGNRRHGKIAGLAPQAKETVHQLLLSNEYYSTVVEYMKTQGVGISQSAVSNYARRLHADMQLLNIAQENFRRMADEMQKYPDLDTTEPIIRLMSQHIYSALAGMQEDDFKKVNPEKLLKEASALIKAVAQKSRTDVQNKAVLDIGIDGVSNLVFESMAKEKPELFKQVSAFLQAKQTEEL